MRRARTRLLIGGREKVCRRSGVAWAGLSRRLGRWLTGLCALAQGGWNGSGEGRGGRRGLTFLFPIFSQPARSLVHIKPVVPKRVLDRRIGYWGLDVLQLILDHWDRRDHLSWRQIWRLLPFGPAPPTSFLGRHAIVGLVGCIAALAGVDASIVVAVVRVIVGELGCGVSGAGITSSETINAPPRSRLRTKRCLDMLCDCEVWRCSTLMRELMMRRGAWRSLVTL